MGTIELKAKKSRAKIPVPVPTKTGKESLRLENVRLGYGENTVLDKVNFRLERGAHLGVVGFNGAGKSTLLKALAKKIPPLSGVLEYGYEVRVSYFAQHVVEDLFVQETVLENLQRAAHPDVSAQEIKNIAGALLFPGDDVLKKIKILSGGEKSRVALGQILLKKNPVLLLDEPTNHLDFDTVEALTEALSEYPGTIVTVSHDRGFIARVATKILEIRNGQAEYFPGTYEDYLWSLEKGALAERLHHIEGAAHTSEQSSEPRKKVNYKDEQKRIESEIIQNKKMIKTLESDVQTFSRERDELNKKILQVQGAAASSIAKDLSLTAKKIESCEDKMLNTMENLERLAAELENLRAR